LTNTTLSAPTGGSYELYGGTVSGGTINSGTLTFTSSGGTLSGANYTGDLSLGASQSVTLTAGAAFTGANAAIANGASLNWNQNGTLAGKTLTMGTSGSLGYISVGNGNSLTLDSATTGTGSLYIYGTTGATTLNQGTLTATSGTSYLYGPTVTNQGTININTGSFYLGYYASHNTINTSTGVINQTGGTVYVYSPLSNSGALKVQGGTLYTNGFVTNGANGLISGAGTISGDLTLAGGTLAPGNSIGTLTMSNGDFLVTGTSVLAVEMDGASSDRLTFQNPTSTVDIGAGLLQLSISLLAAPTPGTNYTILNIASGGSGYTGYFAGLANSGDTLTATFGTQTYSLNILYLANSIVLQVPEPSTYALMGLGLAAFALRLRRRRC
jgi:hypothetical protein